MAEPIVCTENHKFLVSHRNQLLYRNTIKELDWKEAKNLNILGSSSQKDLLLYPVKVDYNNSKKL